MSPQISSDFPSYAVGYQLFEGKDKMAKLLFEHLLSIFCSIAGQPTAVDKSPVEEQQTNKKFRVRDSEPLRMILMILMATFSHARFNES